MNIQKILVIKLRHLGDVLLSTPVVSHLARSYPEAQIDAYIWKEAHQILEGHPGISNFILYDRKWKDLPLHRRMGKELGLLRQIRRGKYDLVMNLTEGDRGAHAALVSGACAKVGFKPKKKHIQKIFTHLVKHCPNPRHTVEKDLDTVRRLGLFPGPHERGLTFHVPEKAKQRARALVGAEPYVVIHAPSRWRFKCLPPHLTAKVIDQLGIRVVLTGAPSEREFVEQIARLSSGDVLNLAGKTSIKEMGAVLQMSSALITVDSVALHMASALKVPVVALFGPTSEVNWGPWMHPRSEVVARRLSCRPCRLDGCGGSKMSDCLWTLSPKSIVSAYQRVTSAVNFEEATSGSSVFAANSFEINRTE